MAARETHDRPHFLILGAMKCGTSSLYGMLCRHPGFQPAFEKEVHFFDIAYHHGWQWYEGHFPAPGPGRITGEASPYYLFHPHCPRRVHECLPPVKLIVLLRNPVDRAYSHYQHMVRDGHETLSFEDALAAEPDRIQAEYDRLVRDERYESPTHRHYSYLSRGFYADQLAAWLRHFPREQLLVENAEDLFARPSEVYSRVLRFLGLEEQRTEMEPLNTGGDYSGMGPETRAVLTEFFRPHNQRLKELLGVDYGW